MTIDINMSSPPEVQVEPPVPDVGAGVAVAAAPHADLQPVPLGEVDSNGHVLSSDGHHDDTRLQTWGYLYGAQWLTTWSIWPRDPHKFPTVQYVTHPADTGLVVDGPERLVPRAAAGDHPAYHQLVQQRDGRLAVPPLTHEDTREQEGARCPHHVPHHTCEALAILTVSVIWWVVARKSSHSQLSWRSVSWARYISK